MGKVGFVAGNLCGSQDILPKKTIVSNIEGQVLWFLTTGEYAAFMQMDYCERTAME